MQFLHGFVIEMCVSCRLTEYIMQWAFDRCIKVMQNLARLTQFLRVIFQSLCKTDYTSLNGEPCTL
jgi:hypothetical protein